MAITDPGAEWMCVLDAGFYAMAVPAACIPPRCPPTAIIARCTRRDWYVLRRIARRMSLYSHDELVHLGLKAGLYIVTAPIL